MGYSCVLKLLTAEIKVFHGTVSVLFDFIEMS